MISSIAIMFIILLVIIGVMHFGFIQKDDCNIHSLVNYILYVVMIGFVIFLCCERLYPCLYHTLRREIIIYLCTFILLLFYLALDFNKSIYNDINILAKNFLIFMYGIITLLIYVFSFERKLYIFVICFLNMILFNVIVHIIIYFSNKLIKVIHEQKNEISKMNFELDNKIKELKNLKTKVKKVQLENLVKSKIIDDNNLTLHLVRAQVIKAIDFQSKGENSKLLESLINSFYALINTNNFIHCGYEVMDNVLQLYMKSLCKNEISIEVDFREIYMTSSLKEQISLFSVMLEYIIEDCRNERVKIISHQDTNSSYFIIVFFDKKDLAISKAFEEKCTELNYFASCSIKKSIKYVFVFQ